MSDLNTLARHLEAINALAEAAHTHAVKCVVSFGYCPVHGMQAVMRAPFPAPSPFSEAATAIADAYDFQFNPTEYDDGAMTCLLLFTPSLAELGTPPEVTSANDHS